MLVIKVCQNLWYSSYLHFIRGINFCFLIFSIRTSFNVSTLNLQFFIRYIYFPAYVYCLMVSIDKHHNCKYFFQTLQRGLLVRLLNLFEINSSMLFHSSLTIWQSAIGVPLFIHEIWYTFILFVYICVGFFLILKMNLIHE